MWETEGRTFEQMNSLIVESSLLSSEREGLAGWLVQSPCLTFCYVDDSLANAATKLRLNPYTPTALA